VLYTVPSHQTVHFAQMSDYISVASITTGAVTNLTTTTIISYQIYSTTARDRRARRRYQHIVNALIQSCSIYTIAAIFDAILGLLGTFSQNEGMSQTTYVIENYINLILSAASVSIQRSTVRAAIIFMLTDSNHVGTCTNSYGRSISIGLRAREFNRYSG